MSPCGARGYPRAPCIDVHSRLHCYTTDRTTATDCRLYPRRMCGHHTLSDDWLCGASNALSGWRLRESSNAVAVDCASQPNAPYCDVHEAHTRHGSRLCAVQSSTSNSLLIGELARMLSVGEWIAQYNARRSCTNAVLSQRLPVDYLPHSNRAMVGLYDRARVAPRHSPMSYHASLTISMGG